MSDHCNQEVFEHGTLLGVFHFNKNEADIITEFIQRVTKCQCDWHYAGGRVIIKFIPKIIIDNSKIKRTLHLTSTKSQFFGLVDCKRLYENMFLILRANLLQVGGFSTDFRISETDSYIISELTIHPL